MTMVLALAVVPALFSCMQYDRFRYSPQRMSEALCMRFNPQSRRRVRNNDCCVPEET